MGNIILNSRLKLLEPRNLNYNLYITASAINFSISHLSGHHCHHPHGHHSL